MGPPTRTPTLNQVETLLRHQTFEPDISYVPGIYHEWQLPVVLMVPTDNMQSLQRTMLLTPTYLENGGFRKNPRGGERIRTIPRDKRLKTMKSCSFISTYTFF